MRPKEETEHKYKGNCYCRFAAFPQVEHMWWSSIVYPWVQRVRTLRRLKEFAIVAESSVSRATVISEEERLRHKGFESAKNCKAHLSECEPTSALKKESEPCWYADKWISSTWNPYSIVQSASNRLRQSAVQALPLKVLDSRPLSYPITTHTHTLSLM